MTANDDGEACPVVDADPDLPYVPAPDAPVDDCGRPNSRFRRRVRAVLPIGIGLGALVAVLSSTSGMATAGRAIVHMEVPWLLIAVGFEITSLLWLSLHLRILAGPRTNAARAAPIRLALVLFGLGNVLPAAPAEGLALATSALKRRRMDRRRIAVLLGFSQWFSMRGLLCVAAVDVLVALGVSDIPTPYRATLAVAAVTTFLALAASTWLTMRRQCAEWAALVAGRLRHPRNCAPASERRARGAAWHAVAMHVTGRRTDRLLLVATTGAAWLCDGLCLHFAIIAAGAHISVDTLLLAYTAGVLASNIPLLPAGLGVVETVTPAILAHYGVPFGTAVAAVLTYRVFGTLLPACAGAVAVVGLNREGDPHITAAEAPTCVAAHAVVPDTTLLANPETEPF